MAEIEIRHPKIKTRRIPIDLSEFESLPIAERTAAKMQRVNEVLDHVWEQVTAGTEIFLIEKSKAK
jgi:hypothetical protein